MNTYEKLRKQVFRDYNVGDKAKFQDGTSGTVVKKTALLVILKMDNEPEEDSISYISRHHINPN